MHYIIMLFSCFLKVKSSESIKTGLRTITSVNVKVNITSIICKYVDNLKRLIIPSYVLSMPEILNMF